MVRIFGQEARSLMTSQRPAVHRADAVAALAQAALAAGYDTAAAMRGSLVAGSAIGGTTLAPGVFTVYSR